MNGAIFIHFTEYECLFLCSARYCTMICTHIIPTYMKNGALYAWLRLFYVEKQARSARIHNVPNNRQFIVGDTANKKHRVYYGWKYSQKDLLYMKYTELQWYSIVTLLALDSFKVALIEQRSRANSFFSPSHAIWYRMQIIQLQELKVIVQFASFQFPNVRENVCIFRAWLNAKWFTVVRNKEIWLPFCS